MTLVSRALEEAEGLIIRRHLREIHFSLGTVGLEEMQHLARNLFRGLRGRFPIVDGPQLEELHVRSAKFLEVEEAFSFSSGRQAWYAVLEALGVGPGDEVILPAYTCIVVPAAVVYRGARPIFCDIDARTFTADTSDVARKVTPRTRVILAQHTYGNPADLPQLKTIADRAGAALVEDCAHTFGGRLGGRPLGAWGDAAFFSFELTKPLSAGRGGLAVASNGDVANQLRAVYRRTPRPTERQAKLAATQLMAYYAFLHPSNRIAGKMVLALLHRARVLSPSITGLEAAVKRPVRYPERLSNLAAVVALSQLNRAAELNEARLEAGRAYQGEFERLGLPSVAPKRAVPLLRWPFLVRDRQAMARFFRRRQIELGVWFNAPLHPAGSDATACSYPMGSAPVAESAARHVANLPTHAGLRKKDIERIVGALNDSRGVHGCELLPQLPASAGGKG